MVIAQYAMNDDKLTPRKLPKQLRSKDTVEAIFTAAMQILERSETEAANPAVAAIAERAGVSVGSLYQYFPSKESLISALIRFHLEDQVSAVERSLEEVSGIPGEQAAEKLISGLIGGKRSRMGVERSMLRFFCRVGDLYTLTEFDERMNKAVEKYILSLGTQVRPLADPATTAFVIANALRSAVLLSLIQNPERLHTPAFKDELVRLVVSYLKPAHGA